MHSLNRLHTCSRIRYLRTSILDSHTFLYVLTHTYPPSPAFLSACDSERAAGVALGYTQVSWDNLSGKEEQPWSSIKHWAALSDTEQKAAGLLGYTQFIWDNESKQEPRPPAAFKHWAELSKCGEGEGSLSLSLSNDPELSASPT